MRSIYCSAWPKSVSKCLNWVARDNRRALAWIGLQLDVARLEAVTRCDSVRAGRAAARPRWRLRLGRAAAILGLQVAAAGGAVPSHTWLYVAMALFPLPAVRT